MLHQNAASDSLKLSTFTDEDKVFVNTILSGTCVVNTDVIQSLTKILEKTTSAADSAIGVEGVTYVLNCLLHIGKNYDHCNWEELHLEFVKLLKLCLNFIVFLTSDSGTFKSLSFKIFYLIRIFSEKHVLVKSSIVKLLSQPVIDFILNKSFSVIARRDFVKSFNHVLSQSSRCLRVELVEEVRSQLFRLPDILLSCGDYDFQTAIMELIFRFISIKASRQSLCSWFNEYPEVQSAFCSTSFKDFDPECRTFLNLLNSSLGSKRLVYTFPCARIFLGETEIFKPKDEHYKEFWVDFNMGSKCISFLCDSSSLTGSTEGNLWEIVSIPCTSVKRAMIDKGRIGVAAPKVAQSLILEMGKLWRKDVQGCIVSVKQIQIIFVQLPDMIYLTEKILPVLFGEVFQVKNIMHGGQDHRLIVYNLKLSHCLKKLSVAEEGLYSVQNVNAVGGSQIPSNRVMSGQNRHSVFRRTTKVSASRVAVVSVSNTTLNLGKYKPLQVTKSPWKCGNRRSQAAKTDIVVCQPAETVVPAEPTKADELTVQKSPDIQDLRDILTVRHIENYNRNAQSCRISPWLGHDSEENLSEVSTVIDASQKCKASIITESVTSPPISSVNEKFRNFKNGSIDQLGDQCELIKKGKEMAVRCWETAPVISYCSKRGEGSCESLDERKNPSAAHKSSMTPSIHLSRVERIKNELAKLNVSSSHRLKSSQTTCIQAGLESSQNGLLINLDSSESKVFSSIKTSLGRPNKLLHGQDIREHSAEQKVKAADGALFGRPKQLLQEPKELTEVPSSYTLQNNNNFQKDKDENLKSVPESSSSSQEVVFSHGTKEFDDKPQEQTELLDLQGNEKHCPNVKMRQSVVSCVFFRRMCNGTDLEEVALSVSKSNLSLIAVSEEGKLPDIDGNTAQSKTFLHTCQEKNECSAAKRAAQNISSTDEIQQTANCSATLKVGSRKSHNKHMKHLGSESVSVDTLDCHRAEGIVSSNEKNLIHKHCKGTEIPAQNYVDVVVEEGAKSCRKISRPPGRLRDKQEAELSVSEHNALNKSNSPAKSECHARRDVKKPQEQAEPLNNKKQNNVGPSEENMTAVCRNVSEALTRLHDKQQEEMGNFDVLMKSTAVKSRRLIEKCKEEIYSLKGDAQNDSDFVEGKKTASSRNAVAGKMSLNSKQQENIGDYAVNCPSLPKPVRQKSELYKKPRGEFEAFENSAQSLSDVTDYKKTLSSRKMIVKSPEHHRKHQKRLRSCCIIDSELVAESIVDRSRRVHNKPEKLFEPVIHSEQNTAKETKMAISKETSKIPIRQHSKQQVQMSRKPEAQIETTKSSNAWKEPEFVHDKKIDSKERVKRSQRLRNKQHKERGKKSKEQIKTLQSKTQIEPYYVENKEIEDAKDTVSISKGLNSKQQVEMSKKFEEEIVSLKESAQKKLAFVGDVKRADLKQTGKVLKRRCDKEKVETMNMAVNISDSVANQIADRSVRLCKKPLEQIELSDHERNLHGQGITSVTLNQRAKRFIHETEEKIGCLDSRISEPLQNEHHTFTKKAVVDEPENFCQMSDGNVAQQVLENNYVNEQMPYTEDELNGRLKETKNMSVSGGNSSELQQGQQVNISRSETTCNLRQVMHRAQIAKFPGINTEGQTAGSEAASEFIVMTTGGKSREVGKSAGKIHSNSHNSLDSSILEPPKISGQDTDVQVPGNNHVSSHSAQKHDTAKNGKVASSSDTSLCGLNIKKHEAPTSDVNFSGSSNCVFSKMHDAGRRTGSKVKPEESREKCFQELCAVRKPHRAGLDPAELHKVIHEWDSDAEGDVNDEFSHGVNQSFKDVMPLHGEVTKNPSKVKIQQLVKGEVINAVLHSQEDSLYNKTSGTTEKNVELTLNVKSPKHSELSLASYAVSIEIQKVNESIPTLKNEECKVNKNSESVTTVNSSSVHKVDAAENVKSPCQLKSLCSNSDRADVQEAQGQSVANSVPCPERLVPLSRILERSNCNFKTPSCKRRLYSSADSPEVIESKDCDDTPRSSNILFTPSSRGAKKIVLTCRKSNENKTPIKRLKEEKRKRRKTESVSSCHEQDQLGVSVSSFGVMSQRAELDVSTSSKFSIKRFSGRWRNKYLEEVKKRKLGNKCKTIVQHPVYNSVYSDIDETDNSSVLSWLEPEKPKRFEVAQKPAVTYEKRRTAAFQSKGRKKGLAPSDTEIDSDDALNQLEHRKRKVPKILETPKVSDEKERGSVVSSRQEKKQVMCPKQYDSQASFPKVKESIIKSKIRRNKLNKQTNKKHSSPEKKTFVTHAVVHQLPDMEVLRNNENELVEEAVPVEMNILPSCNGAPASDRILPSLIVETKHTASSIVPHGIRNKVLNDKSLKERSDEKPLGQIGKVLLSKRDEQPVSLNIGSPYSERSVKPRDQMNDFLLSQKSGQSLSHRIGTRYSESAIPGVSLSLQRKNVLLNHESSVNKSGQTGKGEHMSNKKNGSSNEENIGETVVTKQGKKCKKHTSLRLMTEGSHTNGDVRTMTTKGITEADDGGFMITADDVGQELKLTENSVAVVESASIVTLKAMNPCTTQVRDFMSGFIQSTAEMIEDNLSQTYSKHSKKRKLLVTDYIQNCETELGEIRSKIEHLQQQEAQWQEVENNIKCLRQLHYNYMKEISESMSCLSNYHICFHKKWQKLEEKQQALPLVEVDVKQQLCELMAKKLEEESKNDVAALMVRLQSLHS